MSDPDVIIVGSGVAGVSCAFPLVEAGLKVLMIDKGYTNNDQSFLDSSVYDLRKEGFNLSNYLLGKNFEGIASKSNETPKMKVPQYKYVRKNYTRAYNIKAENINPTGSLSAGGLSNMWGAGVYPYLENDITDSDMCYDDLKNCYQEIASRIGISGKNDDLVCTLGDDIPLLDPIKLHHNSEYLLKKYNMKKSKNDGSFTLGYNRNAVLSTDYNGRLGCTLENCCLWGCKNESIYTAQYDLKTLKKNKNFSYLRGILVNKLSKTDNGYKIKVSGDAHKTSISAKFVCLAAGAIGSTIIACKSLDMYDKKIKIMCHPAFAFPLIFPKRLGSSISKKNFSLGQLAYSLSKKNKEIAFGILFSSEGILSSDIANYMPSSSPTSAFIAKIINPAILLANCYLPGSYSDCHLSINSSEDTKVNIKGGYSDGFEDNLNSVYKTLKKSF